MSTWLVATLVAAATTRERVTEHCPEKMPLTILCSRLVVTGIHEDRPILEPGACALPITATVTAPPARHAYAERDTILSTMLLTDHCWLVNLE
jgi:hypothetical protein